MTSRVWVSLLALAVVGAIALFALPGLWEEPPPEPSAGAAPPAGPAEPAPSPEPALAADASVGEAGAAAAATEPERRAVAKRSVAWLVDAINNAEQFRVRLQAVDTLGRMGGKASTDALVTALGDPHPAVRRAAVRVLAGRRGPKVKAALERARGKETDPKVKAALTKALASAAPKPEPETTPSGGPRYYVGVGKVAGQGVSPALLGQIESLVRSRVQAIPGAKLAPSGESPGATNAVLSSQSRKGLFLDVSVSGVTQEPAGTAAKVSIVIGSYPGRDMRAIVNGKATLPGGTGSEGEQRQAVEGAVRSAMRKLPSTFARVAR